MSLVGRVGTEAGSVSVSTHELEGLFFSDSSLLLVVRNDAVSALLPLFDRAPLKLAPFVPLTILS